MLGRILDQTRARVAEDRREVSFERLRAEAQAQPAAQSQAQLGRPSFADAFRDPFQIIAEIKPRSPSQGDFGSALDPLARAGAYLDGGAAAISVLTERDFFGGDPSLLVKIRALYPRARILMKDFVIDRYQVARARVLGADAVLLIVAALPGDLLDELYQECLTLGITPLVEVHSREELSRALALGAPLIGVNQRNLETLAMVPSVFVDLAPRIPRSITAIAESGIAGPADLRALDAIGYRGFLIGGALMRSNSPAGRLREWMNAVSPRGALPCG